MTHMDTCPVPLTPLHELNERCLELLVLAARARSAPPRSLAEVLRGALLRSTPRSRHQAAARHFLLVDVEFRNVTWWRAIVKSADTRQRRAAERPLFAPRTAIPLARATLTVAWHAIQFDVDTACLLLGMDPTVAQILAALPVTALDRLPRRCHRSLQPRWTDRPTFWRDLLEAAGRNDPASLRALDAQGLQLLTGDLLSAARSHRLTARPDPTPAPAREPA